MLMNATPPCVGFEHEEMDISIIIPTRNNCHKLGQIAQMLSQQIDLEYICWEIIFVDNNSTDDTRGVVEDIIKNWHLPTVPIKYCFEEKLGAGYARRCGVNNTHETTFLIAFIDDDVSIAPDWINKAVEIGYSNPHVGAYTGCLELATLVHPEVSIKKIIPYFGIINRRNENRVYDPWSRVLPPSAALVVRRVAYITSVPEKQILTGRTETNFVTGEDTEMLAYIQDAGWEIWYIASMYAKHHIETSRFERDYLMSFFKGIGLSRHVTRGVRVNKYFRFILVILYLGSDIKKYLKHRIAAFRERDLEELCLAQMYKFSILSPFYWWLKKLW